MHVIFGIVLTAVAFFASYMVKESLLFDGLLNPAALVLLALGPLGVTMVSHPFREWGRNLSVLGRAFRHNKVKSLTRAAEEMGRLARAVRESRWQDAEVAVSTAESEQVRNLAPHLLARLEPDALHEAVSNSSFGWMVEVKTADEFLQGLARVSPAFGMIGTLIGLVQMLRTLDDPSQIGGGMATALLTTLYGAVMANLFCIPLAGKLEARNQEESMVRELMIVGLCALLDGQTPRAVQERLSAFVRPKERKFGESQAA